MVQKAGQDVYW